MRGECGGGGGGCGNGGRRIERVCVADFAVEEKREEVLEVN
jgi:hypothetical protein